MNSNVLYSAGLLRVTHSHVIIGNDPVPLEQILSATDSVVLSPLRHVFQAVGILGTAVSALACAALVSIYFDKYSSREATRPVWLLLWAPSLIGGLWMTYVGFTGQTWRVTINRPFGRRTPVNFKRIDDAQDFLTALMQAKGGHLELERPQTAGGWFVGVSIPLG